MHFSRPHRCFNEESNGEIDIISTGCTGVPGLHRHTCRHTHMRGILRGSCSHTAPHSTWVNACGGCHAVLDITTSTEERSTMRRKEVLQRFARLGSTEHSFAACSYSFCECTVVLVTQGRAAHTPHENGGKSSAKASFMGSASAQAAREAWTT